jgi:hypothetical protein
MDKVYSRAQTDPGRACRRTRVDWFFSVAEEGPSLGVAIVVEVNVVEVYHCRALPRYAVDVRRCPVQNLHLTFPALIPTQTLICVVASNAVVKMSSSSVISTTHTLDHSSPRVSPQVESGRIASSVAHTTRPRLPVHTPHPPKNHVRLFSQIATPQSRIPLVKVSILSSSSGLND